MSETTLITPEILREHHATWWVYTGSTDSQTGAPERIRRSSKMRGQWPGYDVTCSCGWDSKTGGATHSSVKYDLWHHRVTSS